MKMLDKERNKPPLYDRETLGLIVRKAWLQWANTQPTPKPSWLVPYVDLSEADKEADRQIGEAVARLMLTDIKQIKYERDQYKNACKQAGVCMTCVVSAPDTFGCSDCLNTGWEQGDPHEQIKFVEAERDAAKAEAVRLRAFISDAGNEKIQSKQEWKRRAMIDAEKSSTVCNGTPQALANRTTDLSLTTTMPDNEIALIEARANAATPGPWWNEPEYDCVDCCVGIIAANTDCGPLPGNPSRGLIATASNLLDAEIALKDAAFIAHARVDIPRFIAALREARNEVAQADEDRDAAISRSKWAESERDAIANRHEHALIEGAARLAERNAAQGQLTKTINQHYQVCGALIAERDAARETVNELQGANLGIRAALVRIVGLTDVSATSETLEGRAILAVTSEVLNALAEFSANGNDRTQKPLEMTCAKLLPGGVLDDSTFSQIEDALDKAEAPITNAGRWLTLPERIAALSGRTSHENTACNGYPTTS